MLEKIFSLNEFYYKITEDRENIGFAFAETSMICKELLSLDKYCLLNAMAKFCPEHT